ncbi:MAG: methylated-DNA--[protein]-cysteine S-methyltransferase [Chloroflexi bacterium]|nr:methylated-DNA--[protein]-cysteine S-methyltransferase [Chloroflexota bacterium]
MNDQSSEDKDLEHWPSNHDTEDTVLVYLDLLYAKGPTAELSNQVHENLKKFLAQSTVFYDLVEDTPVGPIMTAVDGKGVIAVEFGRDLRDFGKRLSEDFNAWALRSSSKTAQVRGQLLEYFSGERTTFELPISLGHVTDFQREVLMATSKVRPGEVSTYGEIARRIGKSRAARAVGQALARNPMPIVIPCHRVLGGDGALHGYSGKGGLKTKMALLVHEGASGSFKESL